MKPGQICIIIVYRRWTTTYAACKRGEKAWWATGSTWRCFLSQEGTAKVESSCLTGWRWQRPEQWGSSIAGIWGEEVLEKGASWGGNGKSLRGNSSSAFDGLLSCMHRRSRTPGGHGSQDKVRFQSPHLLGRQCSWCPIRREILLDSLRIYKVNIDIAKRRQNSTIVVGNFYTSSTKLTEQVDKNLLTI